MNHAGRCFKNIFLHASNNKALNKAAKKWGLRFRASQVVAGDTIKSAIKKVQELNEKAGFVHWNI